MNHLNNEVLGFYACQSIITQPGEYAYLFECIPETLAAIKDCIHGLLLHFLDESYFNYKISVKRLMDLDLRSIKNMLARVIKNNNKPLNAPRALDHRLIGCCRDFSLLACAILRYHNIPARLRVTFNKFYNPEIFHDQVVLEYWNDQKNKWCYADIRMTQSHFHHKNIDCTFDFFDLPKDKYIPAADVWLQTRHALNLQDKYGGGVTKNQRGQWYIRDRLLQDLAALNKHELLIWDCWGMMLNEQKTISREELLLLDQVAELLLNPDDSFQKLQAIYQRHASLHIAKKILTVSPIQGKKIVEFFH